MNVHHWGSCWAMGCGAGGLPCKQPRKSCKQQPCGLHAGVAHVAHVQCKELKPRKQLGRVDTLPTWPTAVYLPSKVRSQSASDSSSSLVRSSSLRSKEKSIGCIQEAEVAGAARFTKQGGCSPARSRSSVRPPRPAQHNVAKSGC